MKHIIALFLAVLVLSNAAFSSTCASRAYGKSCDKCSFDKNGKMNPGCFEGEQNAGVSCLFMSYPVESISYQMGNCPAVDTCKERLETCKLIYSSGNDKTDCEVETLYPCFRSADACVDYAVKNCDKEPPKELGTVEPDPALCESVMFILPLLVALAFYRH